MSEGGGATPRRRRDGRRPVVTLLTDFGQGDVFVGILKGVVLARCPEAVLVDLSHQIAPYDVAGAGFCLAFALGAFPAGTIHLAVVDPGVGSGRKALMARVDGQLIVAPDNGLASRALAGARRWRAWEVVASPLVPPPASTTFHGRDLFAPVAGLLAAGIAPGRLGRPLPEPVRLPIPRPTAVAGRLRGEVVWVDRYGNCITNIGRQAWEELQAQTSTPLEARVARRRLGPLRSHYAALRSGSLGALIGSSGHLELFRSRGSFAEATGAAPGTEVWVETGRRGGVGSRAPGGRERA